MNPLCHASADSLSLPTRVGNRIVPKKIRGIDLDSERFPLFRGRKCSIRGLGKSNFQSSVGTELHEKNLFYENPALASRFESVFCFPPRNASARNSESLFFSTKRNSELFFSSAEWFGREFQVFASIFVPRNGILFRTSESLLLFLFHSTEFREFFSSTERFVTEFREFSVSRKSPNSAGTNQLFRLFSLARNNFFCRKLPILTPTHSPLPPRRSADYSQPL